MIVSGYASTPQRDRDGDVILPTAFVGAIFDFAERANLHDNHCECCNIGRVLEMNVTSRGLFIRAYINADAVKVREVVRNRTLHSFSVSIRAIKARFDKTNGTRIIELVRLNEVSLVDDPLCPGTTIQLIEEQEPDDLSAMRNARIKITDESLPELKREVLVRDLMKFASHGHTAKEVICFLESYQAA